MRVQVGDLQPPEQLKAVQSPGDTFTGAERPIQDDNLQRLASSLGSFSDTLMNLATTQMRQQKKRTHDEQMAAHHDYLQRNALPDRRAAVAAGQTPFQNDPVIMGHIQARNGKELGEHFTRSFENDLATGNISIQGPNGEYLNPQQVVQNRWTSFYSQLSPAERKDPHFMQNLDQQFVGVRGTLESKVQTQFQQTYKDKAGQVITGAFNDLFNKAAATGPDGQLLITDEQLGKVSKEIHQQGKGLFSFSHPDMEAKLTGLLQENVGKNPDLVERFLNLDRGKGPDGQPLGRLRDRPALSDAVRRLDETIRSEREKRWSTKTEDDLVNQAVSSFRSGDGSFNRAQNYSVENPYSYDPANRTKTFTADSIRQKALDRDRAMRIAELQRQGVNPALANEITFKEDLQNYGRNNIPNTEWQALFTDTARIMGNQEAMADPANKDKLKAAYQIYQEVKTRFPGYAASTLKVGDKEQELYRLIDFNQRYMKEPLDAAIHRATTQINAPKVELDAKTKDSIRSKAGSFDPRSWGQYLFGSEERPMNTPKIQRELTELTESIAAQTGAPIDKAFEAASETLKKNYNGYRGQAMTDNPHMSPEMAPAFDRVLDNLVATDGVNMRLGDGSVGITDGKKLAIIPSQTNPNVFNVIERSNGRPVVKHVSPTQVAPLTITASEVQSMRQAMDSEQQGRVMLQSEQAKTQQMIEDVLWRRNIDKLDAFNKRTTMKLVNGTEAGRQRYENAGKLEEELKRRGIDPTNPPLDPFNIPWFKQGKPQDYTSNQPNLWYNPGLSK